MWRSLASSSPGFRHVSSAPAFNALSSASLAHINTGKFKFFAVHVEAYFIGHILAQSTTDLIQEIKRVAEAQTDSPLRVNSFQLKNCDWKDKSMQTRHLLIDNNS